MGIKFYAKLAALGLAVSLLCTGCGTGVTVLAMVSPSISQVSPQVVTAGSPDVTVTVQGANFESQSSLTVNGSAMPTTFVNSTTLAAKISGTMLAQPAVAQLQVRNADGASSNQVSLTVSQAPGSPDDLAIRTTQLPSAQVGTAYSVTFSATGGSQPYTWSVLSGSLPSGLTLSSAGVLSGTPTASGTSTFTVKVVESGVFKQTKTATYSIVVLPASNPQTVPTLSISSATLGSAQVGASYAVSLSATGGTQSYTWSIASGSLPAGLALSSAGVISGTPTATGTSTFNVTVKDSGSPVQTALAQESITVAPATLSITSTSLAAGTKGSSYNSTLSATGGTPNYTWSVSSGSLPSGLSLSSAGVISGTPTAKGTTTFTVSVKDSGSPVQTSSAQESITVGAAAASTLTITSTSLGAAQMGSSYSTTLSATGGTASYAWSIASGSLPAGLSLSSGGVISGTPTSTGTATFTVSVKDSGSPVQTASSQESITVSAPALAVTSSNLAGGSKGSSYSTTLSASGGTPGYTWSIASGSLPAGLTLSSGGVISGTPTANGASTFTVSVKDSGSPVQTASAQESITVAAASSPLTVTSTSLAAAQVGSSYSATLSASGGTPNYSWSVSSGSLPAGLTLSSSSGVISGTPTAAGTSTFTVSVADSSSPVQNAPAQESITVSASALAVTTSSLSSGTSGSSYSATLAASGGTPSYSWSISSGSLPAGLSLSSAGVISGTPTATGTANFTVSVTDSSSPVQNAPAQESITINAAQATGPGTTWFVRPDGGTRYSANVTNGQCDGQADLAYADAVQANGGTAAPNMHCAFNDVRYMWMDGTYGNSQWVMAGGDTLVIRGCAALSTQQNPDAPHCRIGWDKGTGNDAENFWCAGVNASWGCSMPPPPNGTATQHTRILGACAFGSYSCNPVNGYPYTNNNLTQLFGGFGLPYVMELNGSSYVDVEGLEITEHNGQCTKYGQPTYPSGCTPYPAAASDSANVGISFTNTSTNILLQDVYIHGFTGHGIYGGIGAGITLNRVSSDFNAFAGWNLDDGVGDASNATLTQSYVSMVGNGCLEEYPITDPQFPAKACWDDGAGGFGDSWSGGNSQIVSFSCDHCLIAYNMKDGAIGPHTLLNSLTLTNSVWVGNEGQAWKWATGANGNMLAQNNLIVGNCYRLVGGGPPPGANSALVSHLYLGDACRASAALIALNADPGASLNFVNNTIVTYESTIWQLACTSQTSCGPYNFTNNIILGYTSQYNMPGFNPGAAPGLYWTQSGETISIVGSHNIEYGIRNGDNCGTNGNICTDPLLLNEPAQGTVAPGEQPLDAFTPSYGVISSSSSFNPTPSSPAIGAGIANSYSPSSDYNGNAQTSPPTVGALIQ